MVVRMRGLRQIKLLETLCLRRHDICENLAFELGVSRMTIRRDIRALSEYYPLYTQCGTGGGVFVVDGFRMDKSYLTEEQIKGLEAISDRLEGEEKALIEIVIKKYKMPKRKR